MFESVVVVPIYIYTCILFPWHSLRFYISRCSALALVINCFSTFFFFFSMPRGSVVPAEGIIFRYFILERYFPFRREVCYYSHLREIRPVSQIQRSLRRKKYLSRVGYFERQKIRRDFHWLLTIEYFYLDSYSIPRVRCFEG